MLILLPKAGTYARAQARIERPFKSMGAVMNVIAARMERAVRRNFAVGGRPVPWPVSRRAMEDGGKTLIDRGILLNSIQRSHNQNSATVFTRDKRAAIHQFGGVILPVHAKALTIPISKEARGKRARDFPRGQTFLLKREGKAPLIMLRQEGGIVTPLFVLLRSVKIPARPFIRPTDHDIEEYREMIAGAVIKKT